tara:strand:- start:118 stop:312 length:195 start_codon:yes stop_codon:yes gene_type:complete
MTKKHRQEALAQEAREKVRKPLTEEEISETCDTWIIDSIGIEEVIFIVRRTERAHGIGVEDESD